MNPELKAEWNMELALTQWWRKRHRGKQREPYPGEDTANLRAILIMLVMLYHSTIIYMQPGYMFHTTRQMPSVASNPVLATVLGVLSFALFTPMIGLFFALSGYSFVYTLNKSTNYLILIQKKFWRLIVPLLFIAFCWLLPIRAVTEGFNGKPLWEILFHVFVTGFAAAHLWFLIVLFLMFAVFGLCYQWFGLHWKADASVIVMLAVCLIVLHPIYMKTTILHYFHDYAPFFVLGLMVRRYWTALGEFFSKKRNIVCAVLALALFVAATYAVLGSLPYNMLRMLCMPFPMLLFAVIPKRSNRAMVIIGDNSMRLYLLHYPLCYFSYAYWPNIDPWLMTVINFVGFGTVALVLGLLLAKAHLGVLLGERDFHVRPVIGESR